MPIRHNPVSDRSEVPDNEELSPKEIYNRSAGQGNDLFQNEERPQLDAPSPFGSLMLGCITVGMVAVAVGLVLFILDRLSVINIF